MGLYLCHVHGARGPCGQHSWIGARSAQQTRAGNPPKIRPVQSSNNAVILWRMVHKSGTPQNDR